jgi:hypothetical protein
LPEFVEHATDLLVDNRHQRVVVAELPAQFLDVG